MHIKSMSELRAVLSEEIDKVRDKKTTPQVLKAITNAIGKYLFSVKLELDYCKMTGKTPHLRLLDANSEIKVVKATVKPTSKAA